MQSKEKQVYKLIAINKLMNVAQYLNGDWKPNWCENEEKYVFNMYQGHSLHITYANFYSYGSVYFKTKELAEKAMKILGEDTIRLALSTDW